MPVPANFHYKSKSLFGSNTAWKLQPTTLCSPEVEKNNCVRSPCVLAPNAFPWLARYVQDSLVPGKQTFFLRISGTVGPTVATVLHVPSTTPEKMSKTLSAEAEGTKGMDAHTLTKVHTCSSSCQRYLQFHEIIFFIFHFKGSWLINRNKQYLGGTCKLK